MAAGCTAAPTLPRPTRLHVPGPLPVEAEVRETHRVLAERGIQLAANQVRVGRHGAGYTGGIFANIPPVARAACHEVAGAAAASDPSWSSVWPGSSLLHVPTRATLLAPCPRPGGVLAVPRAASPQRPPGRVHRAGCGCDGLFTNGHGPLNRQIHFRVATQGKLGRRGEEGWWGGREGLRRVHAVWEAAAVHRRGEATQSQRLFQPALLAPVHA